MHMVSILVDAYGWNIGRCTFLAYWWMHMVGTFVTPCFPESVKVTILAKNYGKLKDVNV
jgi:hypothetical protein